MIKELRSSYVIRIHAEYLALFETQNTASETYKNKRTTITWFRYCKEEAAPDT